MIPKKVKLSERHLEVYNGTPNELHEYISVEVLKQWKLETEKKLFKKFDNHIAIGITLIFDELLKFIEDEKSII